MVTEQTALQAKRYGVFHCEMNQTLQTAGQRMVEEDVSALVVVDEEGYLVGIVSRVDMMRALLEYPDWKDHRVKEIMNPDVITVEPGTKLVKVAKLLLEHQIHRIVVVREEGEKKRPISVISAADITYHMIKNA